MDNGSSASPADTQGNSGSPDPGRPRVVCPLATSQLVDVILRFIDIYNQPAGIVLHTYQRVFLRCIIREVLEREGNTITGLWSRQSGKSEALSCLGGGLCIIIPVLARAFPDDPRLSTFVNGFWIGIFAPKQQQAALIYERIRTRAEKKESQELYTDPDIGISVTASRGDRVAWSNGSFVTALTASAQSNVEGYTFHLVIIDEAQLVSKTKISKEINPMLADTNGTLVEIGTANALGGEFKERIVYNVEQHKKTGMRLHFEFPYDQVIAARRKTYEQTGNAKHLNYEKWVAGELRKLGGNIDSTAFRQNFRLLWAEEHAGAIDADAFLAAADPDREAEFHNYSRRIVAGLDYGKKRDCTVLTIAEVEEDPVVDLRAIIRPGDDAPIFYVKRILAWYEFEGRRWHDIMGQVVQALGQYSVDVVAADSTGIGDPLTETLQDLMPGIRVIPVIMSHVGNDRMFKLYIQEIEAGRMRYPAGEQTRTSHVFEQFVYEHGQLLKDHVGVYIRCYAPEEDHDDYCDSGALCCYAASIPRETEVESTVNPFYASRVQPGQQQSRADRYRRN